MPDEVCQEQRPLYKESHIHANAFIIRRKLLCQGSNVALKHLGSQKGRPNTFLPFLPRKDGRLTLGLTCEDDGNNEMKVDEVDGTT